jgi:hypothetical protein
MRSVRTSVVTPYAAYLRVYEPLAAFSGAQRSMWAAYASAEELDPVAEAAVEHREAMAALLAVPPIAVPARDSGRAFLLRIDGEPYVCPCETRLRSWAALEDLRDTVPEEVLDAFVPRVVIDQAEADFARWRADRPDQRPHILTGTWHVPPRWFVPFMPRDRVLELGAEGAARRLYYRVTMVDARRRVARAFKAVSSAFEEGPLTEGIADLGRWLEAFHPRSYVELDYGGLVGLIGDEALVEDHSAADVQEALAALRDGDAEAASAAYRRLLQRWQPVQALEHAS